MKIPEAYSSLPLSVNHIGVQRMESQPSTVSLNDLFEEHFDYLFRYAIRFCRSETRAEDAVQETFLAAAQAIDRFEGRSSPRTWLTGILRHKLMDSVRKHHREISTEPEVIEQDLNNRLFDEVEHWRAETGPLLWGSAPDKVLKEKQFLSTLSECLGHLPERVRKIFLLREMEGFSRDEICEQLTITSTNVGVILYRARLTLQQCLQSNWFHRKNAAQRGHS